jgi:twinkle protein
MEYWKNGFPEGLPTCWPELNPFYRVKAGEICILTGTPGHGKSGWLTHLLFGMMSQYDWRVAMFTPEYQPYEILGFHFAQLSYKKRVHGRDGLTEGEAQTARQYLNDHLTILASDRPTVENILDLARLQLARRGIQGLVIDPWNEAEHGYGGGLNETQYISQSLSRIRQFARENKVAVWVVVHPQKLRRKKDSDQFPIPTMHDIAGSHHWFAKADIGLCVWRETNPDRQMDFPYMELHIQKARFRTSGTPGLMHFTFDKETQSYAAVPDKHNNAH